MDTVSFRIKRRKPGTFAVIRDAVLERDGRTCRYCGDVAVTADHVVPFSYGGRDDMSNLVAVCVFCNSVANDKVFDSFDEKRAFLLGREIDAERARRKRRRVGECADCGGDFQAHVSGATMLLCGSCAGLDEARDVPAMLR